MKVNELLKEVKFKNTFNALYKNHYKNKRLPNHLMVELSMEYQNLFDSLSNDERNIEDIIDSSELLALAMYSLHQKK